MISSKHTIFCFAITLLILLNPGAGDSNNPANPVPTTTVCNTTLDPKFCKSILGHTAGPAGNVYDYGRSAVNQSLSMSLKFLNLVHRYLRKSSTLSTPAVRALQDCHQLTTLNIQFLTDCHKTVNAANKTLPSTQGEDLQTLLSAVLTNQQTCLDGLQDTASAWRVKNGLSTPLRNSTKLYSVALALATRAWVPKNSTNSLTRVSKTRLNFVNGRLSVSMSSQTRQLYEKASGGKFLQPAAPTVDMLVVTDIVIVSKDGCGNFSTIKDAVHAAPNNTDESNGYFMIYVMAGVHNEYVSVDKKKKYLMMVGDGINKTIITGNHSVVDGWTTFNSATFVVTAPRFLCVGMTFINSAGAIKHQAVAVRNGADMSTFYKCSFQGYQDTLYTHSFRQFYRDCDIYGTIDFIFGNAAVVFQNCNIYARKPMKKQYNTLTAQGRMDKNQNTGTSIQNCTVAEAPDLAASNETIKTYMGRPWKEYSRTVFMQCWLGGLIQPAGFIAWSGNFALKTLYYAEFGNKGPGSSLKKRVNWSGYHVINRTVAANFTTAKFLMGNEWLPQTGVTYAAGLDK